MPCRKEYGLPRRFAPRNDRGEASLHSLTRPRPLRTPRTKRPCSRAHVLPSACHCEPVRTLAWQSVLPAEIPDMSVVLRANSQCFSYSPKVLLFAMYCRKEYGLPRRFAPRNDMLKTATPLRLQGTGAAARIPWQKRGTLHPCPGTCTDQTCHRLSAYACGI